MSSKSSTIKSEPLISVIIVNYNAGKLLSAAVRSVIDFPGVEVVVADNASNDGSFIALADKLQRSNLILIDNGANLGFGKAVNQAVKKSHGEYVYLLNPDASLDKSALMRMVQTARVYHDRAIVAPRLENPDGSAQPSCYPPQTIWNAIREYWFGVSGAYSKFLPKGESPQIVNAAVAAAWLVPRVVWDELGGLSDRFFLYFEDLDMCDRARERHIPVVYDPQAIVKHAHGVSSRTNPIVMKLFLESAWTYHGRVKKIIIDAVIRLRDLVTPPFSNKKFIGVMVGGTLWLFVVAAAGYFLLPSRYQPLPFIPSLYKSNFLIWSWANFDGEHYLRIARSGYQTIAGQSEYAFFPLYPLLIKIVHALGFDIYLAAHLVTAIAGVAALYAVATWSKKYIANPIQMVLLLLVAPGVVFLAALYTEPLFIFLAAMTFIFAEKEAWGKAAVMTALATATRINGIFLVLFLMIKMLKSISRPLFSPKFYSFIALSISGFATYMAYLYQTTGDPLAWFHAQSGWSKADATYPWVTFARYLAAITSGWQPDLTHVVVVIEILTTVFALILVIRFWRQKQIDLAYKLFVTGNLALPLATGSLGSMPRFVLTLFPVYLLFPGLSRSAKLTFLTISLILSVIGIILFTRGYWYA